LTWKSFYVRYNVSFMPEFFGITHARGSGYFDVGINHELGHGVTLNLHAGDGRVAGSGNAAWNWRDVRAGPTAKLDDRWMRLDRCARQDTARLAVAAREHLLRWAQKEGIDFDLKQRGFLHIYRDKAGFDHAASVSQLLAQGGLPRRAVTPEEMHALEPTLAGRSRDSRSRCS
jgi:glycine/D-amino acid oxidase-like deaminating enzyme